MKRIVWILVISCALIRTDLSGDPTKPFSLQTPSPVKNWTCWAGDGADLEKISWNSDQVFDFIYWMPVWNEKQTSKISWVRTPATLTAREEPMIFIKDHRLQRVSYVYEHPSANTTSRLMAVVFMWDHHPFCFVFGTTPIDEIESIFPNYRLEATDTGVLLTVSASLSGTGAFTGTNYFDFKTGVPRLIRKTSSSRHGGSKEIPVEQKVFDDEQ